MGDVIEVEEKHTQAGTLKSLSAEDVVKLTTLALVSRTLNTSYRVEEGLESTLAEVMSALDGERGFIELCDSEGQSQLMICRDESVTPPVNSFIYSQTLVAKCKTDKLPVLMFDAVRTAASQSAVATGTRSVMIHPVLRQGTLVGVFYLDSLIKSGRFRENELKLLGIITDMVSVYLERIHNAAALQKALYELRTRRRDEFSGQPPLLLIDSDTKFRHSFAQEAWHRGLALIQAPDYLEALQFLEAGELSAVLVEETHPECSDFLEVLRSDHAHFPVVVRASEMSFSQRLAGARKGVRLFLDKAAPAALVLDGIGRLLGTGPRPRRVWQLGLPSELSLELRERGLEVTVIEASAVTSGETDAYLLDWELQEQSAAEICRLLRSDPARNSIPIVVATEQEDESTFISALDAGADEVFVKPVSAARLRSWLSRRWQAAWPRP